MGIFQDWLQKREDALDEKRRKQVADALDKLSRIPTGKMLLELTKSKKLFIRIVEDLDGDTMARFRPSAFIDISHKCPVSGHAISLAHELRHVWQNMVGLQLTSKHKPLNNIINNRFQEADAYAIEAQVAWELTVYGVEPDAWKEYTKHNKSVANAFSEVARSSHHAVSSGHALFGAFSAWFDDKGTKDSYDMHEIDEIRDYHEAHRSKLGAAHTFDKPRPENAPERMSVEYFREFGQWLTDKNYLAEVDTLNPDFTGNLAPWNQNRLKRLEKDYPSRLAG